MKQPSRTAAVAWRAVQRREAGSKRDALVLLGACVLAPPQHASWRYRSPTHPPGSQAATVGIGAGFGAGRPHGLHPSDIHIVRTRQLRRAVQGAQLEPDRGQEVQAAAVALSELVAWSRARGGGGGAAGDAALLTFAGAGQSHGPDAKASRPAAACGAPIGIECCNSGWQRGRWILHPPPQPLPAPFHGVMYVSTGAGQGVAWLPARAPTDDHMACAAAASGPPLATP